MATRSITCGRGRTLHIGMLLALLALLVAGCKKRHAPRSTTTTTSATEPAEKSAATGAEQRTPPVLADGPPPLTAPLLKFLPADGLRGPASVIHDEASDAYFVSNIDGPLLAADGKGFISKLAPNGKKILPRWIEGGKNRVVLNAPKGMALRGDELWVADIDTVRIFHRPTGLPLAEVKIPGAKALDGLTLGSDGGMLVSDAGLKATRDGLEQSGTDAIFVIYKDRSTTNITLVAKDRLASPRGLFATDDKVWSVSGRSGEIFAIAGNGKVGDFEKLPSGGLQGIVAVGDELLVSSQDARAIFHGKPKDRWRVIIGDVQSPGGIGYDRKRGRVLVPMTTEDEVRVYGIE